MVPVGYFIVYWGIFQCVWAHDSLHTLIAPSAFRYLLKLTEISGPNQNYFFPPEFSISEIMEPFLGPENRKQNFRLTGKTFSVCLWSGSQLHFYVKLTIKVINSIIDF